MAIIPLINDAIMIVNKLEKETNNYKMVGLIYQLKYKLMDIRTRECERHEAKRIEQCRFDDKYDC